MRRTLAILLFLCAACLRADTCARDFHPCPPRADLVSRPVAAQAKRSSATRVGLRYGDRFPLPSHLRGQFLQHEAGYGATSSRCCRGLTRKSSPGRSAKCHEIPIVSLLPSGFTAGMTTTIHI